MIYACGSAGFAAAESAATSSATVALSSVSTPNKIESIFLCGSVYQLKVKYDVDPYIDDASGLWNGCICPWVNEGLITKVYINWRGREKKIKTYSCKKIYLTIPEIVERFIPDSNIIDIIFDWYSGVIRIFYTKRKNV